MSRADAQRHVAGEVPLRAGQPLGQRGIAERQVEAVEVGDARRPGRERDDQVVGRHPPRGSRDFQLDARHGRARRRARIHVGQLERGQGLEALHPEALVTAHRLVDRAHALRGGVVDGGQDGARGEAVSRRQGGDGDRLSQRAAQLAKDQRAAAARAGGDHERIVVDAQDGAGERHPPGLAPGGLRRRPRRRRPRPGSP